MPPAARDSAAGRAPPPLAVPADIQARVHELTLGDIVDIALRNNPATQISWQNARAAAAAYGSTKGQYYPTLDLGVSGTRRARANSAGNGATEQDVGGPTATLTWLIFDLGGRSGSIAVARDALLAADYTHNFVIQDVVLQVQQAYFNYVANRALLDAQQLTLQEARTNLDVTEERHRQGLATIADVLQAKTQLLAGAARASRRRRARSRSRAARSPTRWDCRRTCPTTSPPSRRCRSASSPTAWTRSSRARCARAPISPPRAPRPRRPPPASARSRAARLPSLQLGASGGHSFLNTLVGGNNVYTVNVGLKIPLFSGFSREYDQREAEAQSRAATARVEQVRQQVVLQVFSSYYALQTAARRVRTADDLLASATQSDEVALGRYKAGVGSILDLLTAQSALADARSQWIETRWVWRTALAQLAHDIGVLDVHGESPLRITTDTSATPR